MHDQLQTLENDALRGFLGLDRKVSGMVVHDPDRDDADYPLKEWDLITKIGDYEIDNVGMVRLSDGLRVRFQYLIQKLAENGKVPLSLIRKGEPIAAELPVSNMYPKLIESLRGRYPSYFVFGPLVFSAVTSDLLSRHRAGLLGLEPDRQPARDAAGRQASVSTGSNWSIVASPMFPHRLAVGYSNPFTKVVKEVNGVRIKNLRHLVETLRDCKEKYITISFDDRAQRDDRLQSPGGPRRHRRDPHRQRRPPAGVRRLAPVWEGGK